MAGSPEIESIGSGGVTRPIVDACGLICPMPVLRLRKALSALAPGDIVELHATDAAATRDVPAFCGATGHVLVNARRDGERYVFEIRKAGE